MKRHALIVLLFAVASSMCLENSLFGQTPDPKDQTDLGANNRAGQDIEPPKAKIAPDPAYPKEARDKHLEGAVEMRVVIGIDGRVKDLTLTSGDPLLAPAALDAVRQWTFDPKRVDGQAVEAEVPVCIQFSLVPRTGTVSKGTGCGRTANAVPSTILFQVPPTYPAKARKKHIEGIVLLQAKIGVDGNIQDLSVISGDPELTEAALDAVRQWRYTPTLKDGKPVEVTTKITVTFTLGRRR